MQSFMIIHIIPYINSKKYSKCPKSGQGRWDTPDPTPTHPVSSPTEVKSPTPVNL